MVRLHNSPTGYILSKNSDDANDIKRLSNYVRQVNYFLAKAGHLHAIIKFKLFHGLNYCTPPFMAVSCGHCRLDSLFYSSSD